MLDGPWAIDLAEGVSVFGERQTPRKAWLMGGHLRMVRLTTTVPSIREARRWLSVGGRVRGV